MKKGFLKAALIGVCVFFYASLALAASPVGTWTTIDDKTKKPRSIVKVWQSGGKYYAKILKIYKQPGDTGICSQCPGRLKGKKILGMTVMWGVRQQGQNRYGGGTILDPKNGRTYRVALQLSPNGKILRVRGYVGISLLGRTQIWRRN